MFNIASAALRRSLTRQRWFASYASSSSSSSHSLSIWRRKKEIEKEGQLKRLQSNPVRLDRFIKSHVSRLLKSDLVAVLAELQRQVQVSLSMKDMVRGEIWYRPNMFFYRDKLVMVVRNKMVDKTRRVWDDLKSENVLFNQHMFGDLTRAFSNSGLPSKAMRTYDEMRSSPDPPLSLPFRVILRGLIPYPELREKVKDDFLDLFPIMIVYDPPDDLLDDRDWRKGDVRDSNLLDISHLLLSQMNFNCWSEALKSSLLGTRGLCFLFLGGAAFAFTRRNRYDDSLL